MSYSDVRPHNKTTTPKERYHEMVMASRQLNTDSNPIFSTGLLLSALNTLRHKHAERDTRARLGSICQEATTDLACVRAAMSTEMLIPQYKFDNRKMSRSRDKNRVSNVV